MNRADETFPMSQANRAIFSVPAELAEVKRENAELRRKLHEMEIGLRNALQHVLLMQFNQQSARWTPPNTLDRGVSFEAAEDAAG